MLTVTVRLATPDASTETWHEREQQTRRTSLAGGEDRGLALLHERVSGQEPM